MRPFPRWLLGAMVALTFGLAMSAPPAAAASLFEKGFWLSGPRYDGDLPPCESALGAIVAEFSARESQFWNSAYQISGFDQVRETAFRPWTSGSIPRRYCTARALVSDGKPRTVHYSIIEDGALAGFGPGVEWCVVGLDRNWAYNPRCRMAKP